MVNASNKFLFLAYGLVWVVFMLYAWSLARRQAKLRRELEDLKSRNRLKENHTMRKT